MVYQNGKAVAISKTSESSGLSQDIYSTEEQVVGRWIDGKPLYRRVINGFTRNISVGAEISKINNIEIPIHSYGWVFRPSDTTTFDSDAIPNAFLEIGLKGESVVVYPMEKMFVNARVIVIIEYTKTTDEPTITINSVSFPLASQDDSLSNANLQDTMSPSVMPVTTTLSEE